MWYNQIIILLFYKEYAKYCLHRSQNAVSAVSYVFLLASYCRLIAHYIPSHLSSPLCPYGLSVRSYMQ
jgi:hypothetical protein